VDERSADRREAIGQTVFWKVDCYDPSVTSGSEAPRDAQQTKRVLTIMLAIEC
jgi:hypothetical protein